MVAEELRQPTITRFSRKALGSSHEVQLWTAPFPISMRSSQRPCEGGKCYYSPVVEETEAKVVQDFA